ncbi:hypothetical protein [Niabella hibiscisoli]|uniref:hypothetical protein n=1 Tax=Niabella hibiscisoli TaxID=1825928 RepID=UPI001F0DF5FA|nr:hypothetical protein [Niabella hibiscisoli]MCH5719307.1 hypothetical protein [Niabella hibiscisoli]
MLGFLGFGIKRHSKIIFFTTLIVFTALAISCNKYNDALINGKDKLFLRIKQVDINGKAGYSKIVNVVTE